MSLSFNNADEAVAALETKQFAYAFRYLLQEKHPYLRDFLSQQGQSEESIERVFKANPVCLDDTILKKLYAIDAPPLCVLMMLLGEASPKQVQDFCIWRIAREKPLYTVFMIDDNPSTAILYNLMANRMSAEFIAVGYARGIRESYEILRRLQPDIIVVDHMMPEIDGFEGIAKLKPLLPNSAFLLLSYQYGFDDDSQLIERANAVGADMLRNYGAYLPPAYIKILRETLESFQQGLQDY